MALSCHNAASLSFLNLSRLSSEILMKSTKYGGQTSYGQLAGSQTFNWRMLKKKQKFQKLTAQTRLEAKITPDLQPKIMLDNKDTPHQWQNLVIDLPEAPSFAINPETCEPYKTEDLIPLSPDQLTMQQISQGDVESGVRPLTQCVYVDTTGGLHYHGITPLISDPHNTGSVEELAVPQNESFQGTLKKPDPKARTQKMAKAVKAGATVLKKKSKKVETSVTLHQLKTLKKEQSPTDLCISASSKSMLDQYEVFKYALITESTLKQMEVNNTLVFVVDVRADKKMIRNAVKNIYNIQTKKVNTLIRPDGLKNAYLMLKPDCNALDVANEIGII